MGSQVNIIESTEYQPVYCSLIYADSLGQKVLTSRAGVTLTCRPTAVLGYVYKSDSLEVNPQDDIYKLCTNCNKNDNNIKKNK